MRVKKKAVAHTAAATTLTASVLVAAPAVMVPAPVMVQAFSAVSTTLEEASTDSQQ